MCRLFVDFFVPKQTPELCMIQMSYCFGKAAVLKLLWSPEDLTKTFWLQ